MARPTDDELAATVDHVAVTRLLHAYADAVSRRAWDDVRSLFTDDAVVELDLGDRPGRRFDDPDAFVGFVAPAVGHFLHFQFVPLNLVVDLWPDGDHDRARTRMFMAELRQATPESGRDDAHGLYRDEVRRFDGAWRFAHRRYRSLARFPDGPFPGLPPDPA